MKLADATAAFGDLVRTQKEAEDNYLLYAKKTEEARIAESLDQQKMPQHETSSWGLARCTWAPKNVKDAAL